MFDSINLDNSNLYSQSFIEISTDLNTTKNLFGSEGESQQLPYFDLAIKPDFSVLSTIEQPVIDFNVDKFPLVAYSSARSPQTANKIVSDPLTGIDGNAPLKPSNTDILTNFNGTPANASGTLTLTGTLYGDTFNLTSGYQRYIISGNGNVNRVNGFQDTLNLSTILSTSVQYNWANNTTGGVLYNPGNGNRLFDSIQFNNGIQILFEGIDRLVFKDKTINLSVTPNDPGFKDQWNLHMMGVDNAWRFTKGSNKVLIAVEDTGLGVNTAGSLHTDLRNTRIYANNFRDDYTSENSTHDSHGTAVQSIIAANTNNGIGMSGINWNSPVVNLDVLGENSTDLSLYQATQNAIDLANNRGQKLIVNMSLVWGTRDYNFENLVANNQNKALFVIASGNDNTNSLSYPSWLAYYYNNVIAVGASWGSKDINGNVQTAGTRISYPGWWGSNYGYGLTVMGPSEVLAAKATGNAGSGVASSFGYNTTFNGTSAATPNVAGVASLVWSVNPNLTATQIKSILSQTAFDLGARGYDLVYGNGFINADAAVRRAMAISRTGSTLSALSTNSNLTGGANVSVRKVGDLIASNFFKDKETSEDNKFIDGLDFTIRKREQEWDSFQGVLSNNKVRSLDNEDDLLLPSWWRSK
jgi:hypothetical protein